MEKAASNVVTGIGAIAASTCDSTPFLKSRKTRKFMGSQDELAVIAAARALDSASLAAPLGERCGLYAAIGYIPFEESDMTQLLDASLEGDAFSMQRFSTNAFGALNPLLTFRVLPNMPAFHISLNFDIQGPYAVSYPGAAQFYVVLEEAFAALDSHAIDIALVAAVADQENYLVRHHFSRIDPPIDASRLTNAAACLVVEREEDARRRGAQVRARLTSWALTCEDTPQCDERHIAFGPASLGIALANTRGALTHEVRERGFAASSAWEVA
ncbi:MAG: beta-ketoacyl synthase N-terminal-like domain-containing protein [Thermoanaerobaculia bacterium]